MHIISTKELRKLFLGRGCEHRRALIECADQRSLSECDLTSDTLLMVFFTCEFSRLAAGGKSLGLLVLCAAIFLVVQDATGVLLAKAFGVHPGYGLFAGSVSLAGGHRNGDRLGERRRGRRTAGCCVGWHRVCHFRFDRRRSRWWTCRGDFDPPTQALPNWRSEHHNQRFVRAKRRVGVFTAAGTEPDAGMALLPLRLPT